MVGGTLTAFLAALHYWFPKIVGRRYNERWAMMGAITVNSGFFFTFMPQFLLGNAGMPRRYYSYPAQHQWLNVMSTAGASLLAAGLIVTLVYLVVAFFGGELALGNPWGSRGYEWLSPTPPPKHNWASQPAFGAGPYDYHLPPEETA